MTVQNLSAAIIFDAGATYPNNTVGKRLQDLAEAVIEASIPDGSITAVKLATDSVTTIKIVDANVTTAKLADDAITYAKLQNVSATDRLLGRVSSGAGNVEEIAISDYIQSLLSTADEAALKAAINAEPGTDVQAYSDKLAAIAGASWAGDKLIYLSGADTVGVIDFPAAGRALAGSGESKGLAATLNPQTGTTYTVDVAGDDSDRGRVVRLTNAASITVTLPNSAPVGFYCSWGQGGAGQITFSPASGATLVNRQSHTKSAGQHAQGGLIVYENSGGSAAQWTLSGDTAA